MKRETNENKGTGGTNGVITGVLFNGHVKSCYIHVICRCNYFLNVMKLLATVCERIT